LKWPKDIWIQSYDWFNLMFLTTGISVDNRKLGTDHLTCRGGLWFFVSFRIFFSDNTRVRIFIYFCRVCANFFFQYSTLGYMTKTLNQIIFFPPPKSEYLFFSATLGIRIFFFRKKTHNPPFKLNGSSLIGCSVMRLWK
jgi:hypothetical protein